MTTSAATDKEIYNAEQIFETFINYKGLIVPNTPEFETALVDWSVFHSYLRANYPQPEPPADA